MPRPAAAKKKDTPTPFKPDSHRSDGARGPNRAHGLAGFTLIELVIVTVIVGLLAGIALPQFDEVRERAFNVTVLSDIRTTIAEVERYATTNYAFPSNENDLFAAGLTLSPGVSFTSFNVSNAGQLANASIHAHIEHAGSSNYYHFRYPDDQPAELRWK